MSLLTPIFALIHSYFDFFLQEYTHVHGIFLILPQAFKLFNMFVLLVFNIK